ncbi:(2Fe-2S)-binding protein [Streptomyces sp. NPDC059398]|uniref:(2Fe-2S)-binding protein n=1 Tax=Streptomyces sp. NPDC059398 TaxID=3346820 RepID=UPI00367EA8FD
MTGVREWLAAAGGQPPEAVETRVAASVAHLGLAARLVSPALAAAVLYGLVPAPGLADLRWQPVTGGPVPLSLPADAFTERAFVEGAVTDGASAVGALTGELSSAAPPARLAAELGSRLVDGPLSELAHAMAEFSVSPHILWGNTASAVNGAATMITASRPNLTARTRAISSLLLARPPLRDASSVRPDGVFRRRSCCLIYRAAPGAAGALCGDCVLSR